MIVEALRRSMVGIAFAGLFTFVVLTFLKISNTPVSAAEIWFHMLLAYILGIYFGLSSMIFETEMSTLKQTAIHYFMSIGFYFIIAYIEKWVPLTLHSVLFAIVMFTFIYAVYWTGYYLYFKKVERSLNTNLQRERQADIEHPEEK